MNMFGLLTLVFMTLSWSLMAYGTYYMDLNRDSAFALVQVICLVAMMTSGFNWIGI